MYLVKLHIELNMADLIAKLAKASNNVDGSWLYSAESSGVVGSRGKGLSGSEIHDQCACTRHIGRVRAVPDSLSASDKTIDRYIGQSNSEIEVI